MQFHQNEIFSIKIDIAGSGMSIRQGEPTQAAVRAAAAGK
jgi:hypothetical protein